MEAEFLSLIQTLGFPSFFALLMYQLVRDTIKKNTEALERLAVVVGGCPRNKANK